MTPLYLSQSTMREWDRCKRKWWLSSYRRLSKELYRSPLTVGNLVHDALAAYYLGAYGDGPSVDPIKFVSDRALVTMENFPEDVRQIARDSELAGIMVSGYLEWLEEEGADAEFVKVEPERELQVELRDGIFLIGKLDGRVTLADNWTAFLEHKTVGNFTDLPSIAQIDRQFLTYDLLEYLEALERGAAGDKPLTDGAILNMLRKVKRTATARPPFYARHRVEHNVDQLRSHWQHVVGISQQITEAIEALEAGRSHHVVVPPNPAVDCRWSCAFFDVCAMFDDGSDVEAVLEFEYVERDPLARYEVVTTT